MRSISTMRNMRKTVPEYAQYTGISVATVYRHISAGKLEVEKESGTTYVIVNETQAEDIIEDGEKQRLADENQRLSDEIDWLKAQIGELTQQLKEVHTGSEEASQRHDTIVMQLTQQLDRATKQLEDGRQRRGWWRFWEKNNVQPA